MARLAWNAQVTNAESREVDGEGLRLPPSRYLARCFLCPSAESKGQDLQGLGFWNPMEGDQTPDQRHSWLNIEAVRKCSLRRKCRGATKAT